MTVRNPVTLHRYRKSSRNSPSAQYSYTTESDPNQAVKVKIKVTSQSGNCSSVKFRN